MGVPKRPQGDRLFRIADHFEPHDVFSEEPDLCNVHARLSQLGAKDFFLVW